MWFCWRTADARASEGRERAMRRWRQDEASEQLGDSWTGLPLLGRTAQENQGECWTDGSLGGWIPSASAATSPAPPRLSRVPLPPPPPPIRPRCLLPPSPTSATASASSPRAAPSLDDLRRSLHFFRKSHPSTPTSSSSSSTPSFVDVFASKPSASASSAPTPPSSSPFPFRSLRESLRQSGAFPVPGAKPPDWKSLLSQRPRPAGPEPMFGRDLLEKPGTTNGLGSLRQYSYDELGKRLGDLRPAAAGKSGKGEWFSLAELSARLGRLREMDEEERARAPPPGMGAGVLREALQVLQTKDQNKTSGVQSVSLLMGFGGQAVPAYMLGKPQEELMERYFHPDHMSSAEKMKLELQRVWDEFKMSENDSGSARVQVAQLTTKIKHLSSTLHKKDKHSRKGLQEMVQRRKKYLKYLRRTDWESYSLVLSKLGLRDVPEYKPPDYKSKSRSNKTKTKRKSKQKMKV